MKRRGWIFISVIVLILFNSCNTEKLINFEVEYESKFTIPSTGPTGLLPAINTPEIETSSEKKFKNHNTRSDLVKDVRLTDIDLKIIDPEDETFSFLEKIKIFIKAKDLPKKKVAEKNNISDNIGSRLSLSTTGEKLDPYLKKDNFSVEVEVTVDETIPQDTEVASKMVFDVKADAL